ncbi:alpha/beta hydrolase [Rhodococcoides fascians]|uniref:alpha/beta hydrolase n=1 Tax=Rhodococcoides fascians TaxID=1828 RepID=UPI00050C9064|nr:alpha/beta hydrolase [Rhodococcus fascians]
MHIDDLDPELLQVVSAVPAVDFHDITAARAATTSSPVRSSADVVVTDSVAEFDGHTVSVRITGPATVTSGPLPIVVEMHGGGFALGSAASNDASNAGLATALPCVVVAVDYRLAPEFPYPASVRDCVTAVRWAVDAAGSIGGDPGRIGLLGTSAGACLAACTALELRDSGGPRLAMQALIEPALDDRADSPSMQQGVDAVFWNTGNAILSWQHYLGGRVPDGHTSPARRQDLESLPPTYLTVNELDPLRDQGIDYARRLLAAGTRVEFHCWPGAFHGFTMFDTALSRRTRASDLAAMDRLLNGPVRG